MTLQKCVKLNIEQIKSGARQTEQGRNYAPSTIRAIVTAMNQWAAFQKHVHRVYDFDDINMKCYYDYTTFLKKQKKTGAKVAIPCSSQLLEILRKYDFQPLHLEDQVINRYLKEICMDAGITEKVEIEVTNGGTPKKVWKEKCDLVHTHTARRTGATLMYLSRMDIYDIMKIMGHTSHTMLRKYIKAENLTVVEKITDKYDYFD